MIKRIVIVGGGTAGWMSAAFLNTLFATQLDITLIESTKIGTVGVGEATIPPIQLFNKLIKLNEQQFVHQTQATYKLGIEFNHWYYPGHSYMHAFGNVGKQIGLTHFVHYWMQANRRQKSVDLWDFSLNYQLAKNNKMTITQDVPYAYHFDAGLYGQLLRNMSTSRGVKRIEGTINHVSLNQTSGCIEAVELNNGERVEGDFFIDCSGFNALLIGKTMQVKYDDWSYWLKCDSAIAAPTEPLKPLVPFTRSNAMKAGWQWQIPLQHRTGNGLVYASEYMSADEAEQYLLANLNSEPQSSPKLIRFKPGRRTRQWYKNCLAIGLASVFLEPLESTSLHMVQTSLVKFAKLFTADGLKQANIDEYNRQSVLDTELIRDFIILHYVVNNRQGDPFWDACRRVELPDSLASKLDLFKASGMIFREQNELFTEDSWLQVMIGQGLYPQSYHSLVNTLETEKIDELMAHLKVINQNRVNKADDYTRFMSQTV